MIFGTILAKIKLTGGISVSTDYREPTLDVPRRFDGTKVARSALHDSRPSSNRAQMRPNARVQPGPGGGVFGANRSFLRGLGRPLDYSKYV
jgi:hypothetical protein